MQGCPTGKWQESPHAYHDLTIRKARESLVKNHGLVDDSHLLFQLEDFCESEEVTRRNREGEERTEWDMTTMPDRLAQRCIERLFLHRTEYGIFSFNGEIYQSQQDWPIKNTIRKHFGEGSHWDNYCQEKGWPWKIRPQKQMTSAFVNQVIDNIKAGLIPESQEKIFNIVKWKDPDYGLAFNNGVFHCDSGQLIPFNKDQMLTNKLAVDWVSLGNNSTVRGYLDKWISYTRRLVDTQEEYISLQEGMGYLLPFQWIDKKSIWIKGPNDSGKTTFVNIIKPVIGDNNYTSVGLHKLLYGNFTASHLRKKSVNFCGDLGEGKLWDFENFVLIVGGDEFFTESKYVIGEANTKINATIVVTFNKTPNTELFFDSKILTRIYLITFKKQIEKPDPNFILRWRAPEAQQAIAFWMLEGFLRLRANSWKYPQTPEMVRTMLEKDTIETIVEELFNISLDLQNEILSGNSDDFYSAFEIYAHKWGLMSITKRSFLRKLHENLKEDHIDVYNKRKRVKNPGNRKNYWKYEGIELTEEYQKQLGEKRKIPNEGKLTQLLERNIHSEVEHVIQTFDSGTGVEEQEIINQMMNKDSNLTKQSVKGCLLKLREDGLVYEPEPNYWKILDS